MRITEIRERSVALSRYRDPAIPSGGLTTSIVAVVTDAMRDGRAVIGYGFASIGRFAQSGLIRERFAPRLLAAAPSALLDEAGANIDPHRAWAVMMKGEKPGGHGERCVAVGALDMALWDAAAKIAALPLHRFLRRKLGRDAATASEVAVYASGGYPYPADDRARLAAELRDLIDLGYTHLKIKIGAAPLEEEMRRLETALALVSADRLAVDAGLTAYAPAESRAMAAALAPLGPWWLEDIADPHDFDTLADIAAVYSPPLAAGEPLFSLAEARLLAQHGGLRPDRDRLVFDPVHCYGLPEYLRIVDLFEGRGWQRRAFWPHGGHLFSLHLVSALDLGGAEVNPLCFAPFGGLPDGVQPRGGRAAPPEAPGIGFELQAGAYRLFRTLLSG
jgi:L-alanine-DL-glutamate epimerase-like enolase superfamily enzyme